MDKKQRLIEALEQDIREWEDVAKRCGALADAVFGIKEKERMVLDAKHYRARAKAMVEVVKIVRESN